MELKLYEQDELELVVDMNTGECYCSQRALARMCNVSDIKIKRWKGEYKIETKTAKIETGGGLQGATLFDEDSIYKALAKYNTDLLIQCAKAGLRLYLHGLAGVKYQPRKDYSRYLLKEPRVWTKVFGDDFYDELARLTGKSWDRTTHKRPCYFAGLTYDLVYSYLPTDVYQTIKNNQRKHGGYVQKIHQYLTPEGLKALQSHLQLTMNILTAAATEKEARRMIYQAVTGEYQLTMF